MRVLYNYYRLKIYIDLPKITHLVPTKEPYRRRRRSTDVLRTAARPMTGNANAVGMNPRYS